MAPTGSTLLLGALLLIVLQALLAANAFSKVTSDTYKLQSFFRLQAKFACHAHPCVRGLRARRSIGGAAKFAYSA